MNLNLGLESLNGSARGAVVPFTPASAIEMQNASEAITNLMASLESYYDAARNAMLVKKAVKKYGKTQSIVALIGQEGLAAAQSFSMEGFWEKVKNFLIKIWEKIKEWWGRFWGMFFSVENKLGSFISSAESGNKKLAHTVEFDAPDHKKVKEKKDEVAKIIDTLVKATSNVNDSNILAGIQSWMKAGYGVGENESKVSEGAFSIIHYALKSRADVLAVAKNVKDVITAFKDAKRKIDDYTKKALEAVKKMKVNVPANSGGDVFGRGATTEARTESTSDEQDYASKVLKNAAKLQNAAVAACVKAATQIAIKLMAHTRLTD